MRPALLTALLVVVALLTGCSSTPAADAALCEEQEDGPMRHLHVDNGTDGAKLHENSGFWPHSIWLSVTGTLPPTSGPI